MIRFPYNLFTVFSEEFCWAVNCKYSSTLWLNLIYVRAYGFDLNG